MADTQTQKPTRPGGKYPMSTMSVPSLSPRRLAFSSSVLIAAAVMAMAGSTAARAAADDTPPPAEESPAERDARMGWWREARFGMFVHWGLYSALAGNWDGKPPPKTGGMEWIQKFVEADTHQYASRAVPAFKPKPGFAKEWAAVAKKAGCQYVVFTTKHHDGFALHDSKLTQYDAGDILNRDLVKEITEALRAEGLRVGFYHSVIDWHHPQYDFTRAGGLPYPEGAKMLAATPRDHSRYIAFLHGQVEELLRNYGKVDILWWDYSSAKFQGDAAWGATALMEMSRAAQPGVIMNNRLFRRPKVGADGQDNHQLTSKMEPRYGDFVTPEQHIPETGVPGVDWETCMTMNGTWGFSQHDHKWKSSRQLIQNLIDIASKGGNYLLNIGPMGDGTVPPESVAAMEDIGKWMAVNQSAILGTTASTMANPGFDGRVTTKGKTHFLHVFKRPADGTIRLPIQITKATMLAGGAPVAVARSADGSILTLPESLPDPVATVIQVESE